MQTTFIGSTLLLASAGVSFAAPAIESPPTDSLSETVVTATRSETASHKLATAATVYTRADIERLQVRTLPELLRGSTGVDIIQSGGYGQPSSVFIRGTNSSHVLVLIDGIKAGSVTAGITAFELLPIDQIERVEIIRGPQSSLYGSEAIGGVIQIFTRKGKASDAPRVQLEAGAGSFDSHRQSGQVSGGGQNSWYNLGVSNFESRGYNAQHSPYADTDRDGYRNTAVNARAGHRFDNSSELEAFFTRAEGLNLFDGYGADDVNRKRFVNQVVGTRFSYAVSDSWRSSLNLGQSRDEGSNYYPNHSFASSINTTRWNASWLNTLQLSKQHQAVLGTDYRVDEVEGSTAYDKRSRYDVGLFAELHSQVFSHHFINSSLRWDENQAFGDALTGSIGWRYNAAHGLSVFGNFGNAFKAPTFNDLYYPGFSNPSLKPEQSSSVEAGLAGSHGWGQWELRAYHTDIDQLIAYVWPLGVLNINKAQIDGIEAQLRSEWLGWQHQLQGNLISPINRETDSRLLRRADKTLSYDLSRRWGAVDLGGTVLAQSDRPDVDYDFNPTQVAGFVTVDLRTAYHVDKHWLLSAKLNNLLDKHYQTVSSYPMADRNVFFTIQYTH